MHIFVSYARREAEVAFVQRLTAALVASNRHAWVDVRDLEPGRAWPSQIDGAIRLAYAFILVLSRQGSASAYVTYEWAYALGAGVPVLPLLMERDVRLHPRLLQIQFVDCVEDERRGFGQALDWLSGKDDPNFKTIVELQSRLASPSEADKARLLRTLAAFPGKRGREVAFGYADRAVEGLRAASTRQRAETEIDALLTLHAIGAPDIKDRLVSLNYELVNNSVVQPLIAAAVSNIVLRGRAI